PTSLAAGRPQRVQTCCFLSSGNRVKAILPSGETPSIGNAASGPSRRRNSLPFATSHRRTVRSPAREMRAALSALKATSASGAACPVSVACSVPFATSQTLIVFSSGGVGGALGGLPGRPLLGGLVGCPGVS